VTNLCPPTEHEKAALRTVLGCRVRGARAHLKLSQRGLAKVLDMSGSWVREIEAGAQFAPAWLIALLAEATGWNISWFYGFGARQSGVAVKTLNTIRDLADGRRHYDGTEGYDCFAALGDVRDLCDGVLNDA